MNSNDIRTRFLEFFEARGHMRVPSSPLLPAEDPTLLFTNAGMNQFKDLFLGTESRTYSRATTSQKCVRAGGKHNDLEMVGRTRRHQTFFEMLGNFSFGDYFKKEAIAYAWELLTVEFGIPTDKLWITVFEEDDEAAELWKNDVGVAAERVVRMDEKDNFWQMGDTGPCGPCSEIHYDFGPEGSQEGHADCRFPCECGRYLEIWNLVFMQFDRDETGTLNPLPKPSIDTGMGFERIASVLQGKISNYDTDLFSPLLDTAADLLGVSYGTSESTDTSLRIIADHVRATTFLIGDGIIPSNEGRGYVLRKIMRRGIRQGTLLGRREPFLHTMTGHVVDLMKGAYPDLVNTRDYVDRVVENEEKRFSATVAVAVGKLEDIIASVEAQREKLIPGKELFKLYDTFGLPLDFTEEIAREKSLELDIEGFNSELDKQKERARESWKGGSRVSKVYESIADGRTDFLGYETTEATGTIIGLFSDGKPVDQVEGLGSQAEAVLDRSPFYAESGGQVGVSGGLTTADSAARVTETFSPSPGLIVHRVVVDVGRLKVGETVSGRVDVERRNRIAANHTGTHLLHAALRRTLGVHVKQAGSLVAPDRLRFDYTHYAPLTPGEIEEIEGGINRVVLENRPVETREMALNEAVESGAIAFFGEKYQQDVRVVTVADVSMELCGGTHTTATGDVGLFKIVSESSVAAGVRRIEAVTGLGSYERFEDDERLLDEVGRRLRSSRSDLTGAIDRLFVQQKELEEELASLKRSSANSNLDSLLVAQSSVSGISVIAQRVEGVDVPLMRELAESARDRMGSGVVVLGTTDNGKAMLVTTVSEDLRGRLHAGKIIKQIAILVGGNGGGRPDFAQAGGKEPEKLDQALQEVYNIVADMGS